MQNNTNMTERAYTTSEIATMIDIAVPTVRKYSQSLESQGYVFLKGKGTGQHQARLFLDKDIIVLRYLKDIREKGHMTVEQATSVVVERFGKGAIHPIRSSDIQHDDNRDKQYIELKRLIEQQNDLIQNLADKVDKQQEYITNGLEERDKNLMKSMNELVESRKQIAIEEEPEVKKSWLQRLFKKS